VESSFDEALEYVWVAVMETDREKEKGVYVLGFALFFFGECFPIALPVLVIRYSYVSF
jgi:hypothetical protein